MDREEKKKYAQKVTIIGSIADALLGILKIIIGKLFYSHALVIDGIHSFTDVVSDIFVVIITRISHEAPDEKHPYGHEKFETIGSAALGSLLLATGGALIYETLHSLWLGENPVKPGIPTYWAAGISLLLKEGLFHYTYRAGKKLDSKLIMANAWHSRTDALSSLIVLIGLIFSGLGFTIVDSIAAVIVAFIIARIGWRFVKESLVELAETSVEERLEESIRETILGVDGVESCHALRTRQMGPKVLVDVNIEVNSLLTASEGHEISAWVIKNLKDKHTEIFDVTVHMDVEDDMEHSDENPYLHTFEDLLPLRKEVLSQLEKAWSSHSILKDAQNIRLHYIKGKVIPEVILESDMISKEPYNDIKALSIQLNDKASIYDWYGRITILFGEIATN